MQQNLNSFVDPKQILRDLDVKVNRIPDTTNCPFCRSPNFYAGQDPRGGAWFTCDSCRWVGDTLQLFSRVRNVSIEQAAKDVRQITQSNEITEDRIDYYLRHVEHQHNATDFWLEASDKDHILNVRSQSARQLLDAYRIPGLATRMTWPEGAGQLVGVATRKMYEKALQPLGNQATSLPGVKGKHYVISPMFDAPGRISAVAAFHMGKGEKRYMTVPIPFGSADALLFLNSIYMYDDVVFATPDLPFALCLQLWAYQSNRGQVPILGYTEDTNKAWANVRPQKLIFWDRELHNGLFIAARKVSDRAYIARKPVIDDTKDPFYHLQGWPANQFLGVMQGSAFPWLRVLKEHLLSRSYGEAHELVVQLDLMPSHRQELVKYCQTVEERKRLADIVDTGVIEMRVPTGVSNQYIVQKSDGWYLQNKTVDDTLVSGAIPVVETYTSFDLHTVLSGYIRVNDPNGDPRNLPFEVNKEDFTPNWLVKYCFDHGCPTTTHSRIHKDLFHYTIQFHKPVKVDGLDRIGWDGTGFIFPRFAIKANGKTVEQKRPIARPHPTQELHPISSLKISSARTWMVDTPACVLYWALAVPLITNILAPAEDFPTRGIGLVDRNDDGRRSILQRVLEDLCIPTHETKINHVRESIMATVAAEHEHDMPIFVDTGGSSIVLQWMQDTEDRNAVTLIPPGIVRPALLRGGWTIVDCRAEIDEDLVLSHGHAILPSVLDHYTKLDCKLPARSKGHPTRRVCALIKALMAKRFGIEKADVLDKAMKLVDTGTDDGIAGAGARFIGTLVYLLGRGSISATKSKDIVGYPDDKSAITVNPEWIYLNFSVIRKAFDKNKLFMPDMTELSKAFFDSEILQEVSYGLNSIDGWYLDPKKWDEEVHKWSDS